MADNELWFTALGPSGAGKTTMLACMQKRFDDLVSGSVVAEREAFATLTAAYRRLEEEADSSALEFGVGIENTENLREYAFTLAAGRAKIPMRFFDFPGGWIDMAKTQSENYSTVVNIMKRSRVIFVAVNTPYLMEGNGRYKEVARIDDTVGMLRNSLVDGRDNKLVLIVPIKCEKYTRNPATIKRMYEVIDAEFSCMFELADNPDYKKRLAIAVMPIHTVGNATFSRFERIDGRMSREIYLKNRSAGFSPKYADQPLRYAMSFLLNEFARGGDAALNDSFSRENFNELRAFIRKDMEINNGLFKFYNGQSLVTDLVEVKEVQTPFLTNGGAGVSRKLLPCEGEAGEGSVYPPAEMGSGSLPARVGSGSPHVGEKSDPPKSPLTQGGLGVAHQQPTKPPVMQTPPPQPQTWFLWTVIVILITIIVFLVSQEKIVIVKEHQTFWEWVWSLF